MSASLIHRYPLNAAGRDFVVGDIHGAYDLLWQGMKRVGFDRACDRLFCVGDLIDRGPESARVAQFLAQPYVHAVRGNHEEMLLQLHADGTFPDFPGDFWLFKQNGMTWWPATPRPQQEAILAALRALPMVIEIDTPRGTVGIVHAEVPAGLSWVEFLRRIERDDPATLETAVWGRERIQQGDETGVRGIGRVFVGHTILWGGARRFGNVYAVDTGAIFSVIRDKPGALLTLMNLQHRTESLSRPPEANLNILDDPATGPFGAYSR